MTAPHSRCCLGSLTRRHGVKVASAVSVEKCCLAVGEVVGHENIMSASRMNNATVVFLSTVELLRLVEAGIVVDDLFNPVLPLSTPSKKVTLSNVPPFLSDEILAKALSQYGKLVSPIKKIPIGGGLPLLKHVVSFRRFVYMVVNDDADMDLSLHFRADDYDYIIYVTSGNMRCFSCGQIGHLIRACPGKNSNNVSGGGDVRSDVVVSAEAGPVDEAPGGSGTGLHVSEAGSDVVPVIAVTEESVLESTVSCVTLVVSNVQAGGAVIETEKHLNDALDVELQPTVENMGDVISMETVQEDFKVPLKRRKPDRTGIDRHAKKSDTFELYDDTESDSASSDSSVCLSQSDFSGHYEVDDIKLFLRATKNKRGVCINECFPNTEQFVENTKAFMMEGSFTNKEVYRLKKIVRKLNSERSNEDRGET